MEASYKDYSECGNSPTSEPPRCNLNHSTSHTARYNFTVVTDKELC